jgi:hypothetical protein
MRGHKTGLSLGKPSSPLVEAMSFWLNAPRQGWAQRCCLRFGIGFDGERIQPLAVPILPVGRPMSRAFPSVEEHVQQIGKAQTKRGRRWNTQISQYALRGQRLIG